MPVKHLITAGLCLAFLVSCATEQEQILSTNKGKPVVYQVFTRLFGNKNSTNKPWGTREENGVGKFNDFTDRALKSIKELGVTHIWYTGVPHHALITDYSAFGIANDDADVIKGRAGSPYAVKDYYSVNPDLATDPAHRLAEFKALITRTHKHGMKVIIDIVPNHIARGYYSLAKPDGIEDFGATDDVTIEYARDNNFYYVVGQDFKVPIIDMEQPDLGQDGIYKESPAKWTGNGSRKAQPDAGDWYETVKVNYGVRPDGSHDFPSLPDGFASKDAAAHFGFWVDQDVPDSWKKFRNIALYWLDMGVDGFRYDMAEMVPVEFWSYLNASIKMNNPEAFLLGEIYQPDIYRDYIKLGKMDYLYDKVGLYDTLKGVLQGKQPASDIAIAQGSVLDIEEHMLHFLENHDEQRIASADFAGNPDKAKPAMVVSALIGSSPTMLYFAQELGEAGDNDAGFGKASRTSIFDYSGVPAHQRWMNGGRFDGGQSTADEMKLRDFYQRVLSFSANSPALKGNYAEIHSMNVENTAGYGESLFAFVRWNNDDKLIIISNFDSEKSYMFDLILPKSVINSWQLADGKYQLVDQLYKNVELMLDVESGQGTVAINLDGLQSLVLKIVK